MLCNKLILFQLAPPLLFGFLCLSVCLTLFPLSSFPVSTRLSLSLSGWLQRILAQGSCQIDHEIESLDGPEAFDTAMIMVEFESGKTAVIDVCRQAPYG